MALPIQTQAKYWGLAAIVLFGLLWVLGDVLLPFVLGGALAYLLDPVADRLERMGLSRALAVAVIALVTTLGAVLCFYLLAANQRGWSLIHTMTPTHWFSSGRGTHK